jgi:dTDP-glucose 4,6-dehydratase
MSASSGLTKKAIVTGGAGFIGSHLVLKLTQMGYQVCNVDKLSYASSLIPLENLNKEQHQFHKLDICETEQIKKIIFDFKPVVIFHLAAESHVDRSISGSDPFIKSNIEGTHSLLKVAREYYESQALTHFKFIHVSTDEVYGSLSQNEPAFTEETPYKPNSPYSASKASSDHLARAWSETYKLPVIITHCSNNYGPHQYPEKLIPLMIHNAVKNIPLPVYGNGKNIRDWIHVEDHVEGLIAAFQNGLPGEVYNFGGENEIENIFIVNKICELLDQKRPSSKPYNNLINFVTDRKGHDFRYAINNKKSREKLDWKPKWNFDQGLESTLDYELKKLRSN